MGDFTYIGDGIVRIDSFTTTSNDGNFGYIGTAGIGIDALPIVAVEFEYIGTAGIGIDSTGVVAFQLAYIGTAAIGVTTPGTGIVRFLDVPGASKAVVTIDGVNVSNNIEGDITVTREDNTAARFSLVVNSELKAVEFINKEITILFQVVDMDGVVADYIHIFKGLCKRVRYNYESGNYDISGFDYGGIHQTKGELVSKDITNVLSGTIFLSGEGVFNTGKNPIWGVTYSGNEDVIDGRDYFVDTLNGTITVPVSSALVQFPNSVAYQYMNPFGTLRDLIQEVLTQKGWNMVEDGVTLVDYTDPAKQPVLSISNESVIDVTRKFLELSGAKLESNLWPSLRVYSELANFQGETKHTIDQSIIFGGTMTFDIDFNGLINKQTVRSVQKTNASVEIGASGILAEQSGSQGREIMINQVVPPGSSVGVDINMRKVLVTVRLTRANISSLSFVAGGTFSLGPNIVEDIKQSDWSVRVEDNSFIFELSTTPFWILTNLDEEGWFWYVAYPDADWTLIINGQKITYSDASEEGVVEVTGTRAVTGVSEVLEGDVHENPYIETSAHAANLTSAILVEHGNVYFSNCQIPIYAGKSMNIGDKISIVDGSDELLQGLTKVLRYTLNTQTGKNTINIGIQGVGITI
jgi:hypothetical protein